MKRWLWAIGFWLSACAHTSNGVASRDSIQWIDDDYPAALARARAEGKPVFVDIWATWCHSCLSMQRYVFADAGMKGAKEAAVFASVDQEKPSNRAFVSRFPVEALPTFLLIDPKDESIVGRWLGSGSVADLRAFVEEGAQAMASRTPGSPLSLAREGDAAQARRDVQGAVAAYEAALAKSGAGDRFRPQILVKLVAALWQVKDMKRCAELAVAELDHTGNTSLAADFATGVGRCRADLRPLAEVKLQQLADDASAPLSADDRSDALGSLVEFLDQDGRHDEALAASRKRKQVLLAAQEAAPDVETASTFDPHLMEAFLALGELPQAEALMGRREKEMPKDYNPPARLARIFFEEKKLPEAELAVDRALALAPKGPRRAGFLALKARILAAEGKPPDPALREELELLESLPPTQKRPKREAEIRALLGQR